MPSLLVVLFVVLSIIPCSAASAAKIIFKDVTDDVAYGAMKGEAKVLVSVDMLEASINHDYSLNKEYIWEIKKNY